MKGYKVVKTNLTSASLQLESRYRVQYRLNEWVEPKVDGTRLFFFKNLKDAKRFYSKNRHYQHCYQWEIYSCEAENVGKVKFLADIYEIDRFWKLKKLKKLIKEDLRYSDPESVVGTYSASRIKLLEKIT